MVLVYHSYVDVMFTIISLLCTDIVINHSDDHTMVKITMSKWLLVCLLRYVQFVLALP